MRSTVSRLFAVVALAATAAPTPAAAAPVPGADDPIAAARKALDKVGDMTYQNTNLAAVIADIKDKEKIDIAIDPVVSQFGFAPDQMAVNVALKKVKLRDGLRAVLAPFNLQVGLVREGLYISTEEGLIGRQLRQRVSVACDGTPLAVALKQLAADTGANVVIDPRLPAEAANARVTLTLDDVPLEPAVRLLAELTDLRVVRMSNVLFVTTRERAEKLRPDADGPTPAAQPNPFFPVNPPPIGVPFGGAVPAIEVKKQ